MYSTADFKRGLRIEYDGTPYSIVEFQHVKPGKGGAFVRTKLRNLITGSMFEKTFRAGEKVDKPDLEEKKMQYLYVEGGQYYFMDTETYEQTFLTIDQLGDSKNYLQEGITINALFYQGRPIGVELPIFVILQISKTEPGVRGDTASGGSKPATMETGAVIQVPLFLNEGDKIKIDTRTGEYIERVS
ncbi:MAG TPA: elongation factor P [Thermodesulfobacteriota bacterium]|nr:elongation factor P [Deltaproteobacteria bacterium]HNR12927.1 elongation factor P [Thermodesulfobacteriota bacterium]HQO78695.1 elongation factor P [Thermodesulfobacteriota bacterium]